MKKILYYFFFMSAIIMMASCRKEITDLNENPTRPANVPSAALFSNASVNLAEAMAHTNVNRNNFRLWAQHWTEVTYRDETRYNINGRSISDRWWATFYRDVIKDLTESTKLIDEEIKNPTASGVTAAIAKNRKAINEILMVYSYSVLLTTFGNVPYTEALDIENLQPVYDDAATVFGKISTRLNDALAALDVNEAAYGSADVILNDDINQWKKFGYSLKMRLGMLVADSDPGTASTMIADAASKVITSNDENIQMHYLASPPNTNPVWEDLIQSGRFDFVAARTLADSLNVKNDPRRPHFFNLSKSGGVFVGQFPGTIVLVVSAFSLPSDKVANPQNPHTFFSFAEMEFLKAEAIERNIGGVAGTAQEHYNNAVRASILEWGGTNAEADVYLAQPSVAYDQAPGTFKQKIGTQSWIALYNRGFDAWTQYRRLDFPVLPIPNMGATNPFANGETPAIITRMTYPVVEQNVNKTNYNAGSAAIGKDQITQKLWFDKF